MRKLFIFQVACVLLIGYLEIRIGRKLCCEFSKYSHVINSESKPDLKERKLLNHTSSKKALVVYVYFERNKLYQLTLQHFVDIGVQESNNIDYLFVIQDWKVSVELPINYTNVKVLKRPNTCFDFGAFGLGLEYMGGLKEVGYKYQYFILMNPSAFGPILPKYWPDNIHWTEIFLSRFKGDVHAVGPTISCSKSGPFIDGWFVAMTYQALVSAHKADVFRCHKSKEEAIGLGEVKLSQVIIDAGYNLDSLLCKYPSGFDWRDRKNWNCYHKTLGTRGYVNDKGDFRFNVHPFETVFYKAEWYGPSANSHKQGKLLDRVYLRESLTYMEWARKRKLAAEQKRSFSIIRFFNI